MPTQPLRPASGQDREREITLYSDTDWFKRENPAPALEQALAWACAKHPEDAKRLASPALAEAFKHNTAIPGLFSDEGPYGMQPVTVKGWVNELRKAYRKHDLQRVHELSQAVKKMASDGTKKRSTGHDVPSS